MINEAEITEKKVNLVINRLNRQQYDELCASVPIKLNEYELYLVDDINYDVFNKRVINVGEPDPNVETDGVNVGYVKTTFIKKNEISDFVDCTKIYSPDSEKCLSSDGRLCKRYFLDTDWETNVVKGSYLPNLITVFYNGDKSSTGTNFGWSFNVNNEFNIYTNNQDLTTTRIDGENQEKGIKLIGTRPIHWENLDLFIRKTEISSCLSDVYEDSSIEVVSKALCRLKEKCII